MRYLKILICFLVQFLVMSSLLTLMAEELASRKPETECQEEDNKIKQASMWNLKGKEYYNNLN